MKKRYVRAWGGLLTVGMLAGAINPVIARADTQNGWETVDGKYYWYEDGVKQSGKEIYDPETDAWYWLDSNDDGAKAVGVDVYLESDGGKWVRFDEEGRRVGGEDCRDGIYYYFDSATGAMVKGALVLPDGRQVYYDVATGQMVKGDYEINGVIYHFDETDGHLTEGQDDSLWVSVNDAPVAPEAAMPEGAEGVPGIGADGTEFVDSASTVDGGSAPEGSEEQNGWVEENGQSYWYEDGVKQSGKEIYDPETDAWYWLDSDNDGAKAVSTDVYVEAGSKWIRLDEEGRRVAGEDCRDGLWYYFEPVTGTMIKGPMICSDGRKVFYDTETGQMVKGEYEVNGEMYLFDEVDGHLIEGAEDSSFWLDIDGGSYWYVNWERQGWKPEDPDYAGEELHDAVNDVWYWLDGRNQGKMAVNVDVYQESRADAKGNMGKWVRYDENGHMVRGWSEDGMYYFDPDYGTMARGKVIIDGMEYEFDVETGLRLTEGVPRAGFEDYGIECNAKTGVAYDYVTNCYVDESETTLADVAFEYSTFEADDTHEAKEGYEWKQVRINMVFYDENVKSYGYRWAMLYDVDYYSFTNAAIQRHNTDEDVEGKMTVELEGQEYEITTHYQMVSNETREDGRVNIVFSYECQVPVGYDGMVVALYNAANLDNGIHPLDRLDDNSLIFRME